MGCLALRGQNIGMALPGGPLLLSHHCRPFLGLLDQFSDRWACCLSHWEKRGNDSLKLDQLTKCGCSGRLQLHTAYETLSHLYFARHGFPSFSCGFLAIDKC